MITLHEYQAKAWLRFGSQEEVRFFYLCFLVILMEFGYGEEIELSEMR